MSRVHLVILVLMAVGLFIVPARGDYVVKAAAGQMVELTLNSGSFGSQMAGSTVTLENSLTLVNVNPFTAVVKASFNKKGVADGKIYGLYFGNRVIPANDFSIGSTGNEVPLDETGVWADLGLANSVPPQGSIDYNAILRIAPGLADGTFRGSVNFEFQEYGTSSLREPELVRSVTEEDDLEPGLKDDAEESYLENDGSPESGVNGSDADLQESDPEKLANDPAELDDSLPVQEPALQNTSLDESVSSLSNESVGDVNGSDPAEVPGVITRSVQVVDSGEIDSNDAPVPAGVPDIISRSLPGVPSVPVSSTEEGVNASNDTGSMPLIDNSG